MFHFYKYMYRDDDGNYIVFLTQEFTGVPAYVNMFNHGINDVKHLLKENDSPEPEFNINLNTAFSVVVREPKVEVMGADGSIIKETTQTTTQTTTEKDIKTTQKTEKTTQKTTMNDRKTMEKNAKATQKTTEKNTRTTQKTTEKILETIKGNPSASRAILAEVCGISQDGIKWQLKKLQDQGIIRRVGPDFGGHWEIVRSEENE